MRRPLPSPRMITEVDEAMLWLRWLEVDDAKLVWARAERVAWKQITWQFGMSRTAATRRWQFGLAVMVWRLRDRQPPTHRSMGFVIAKARTAPFCGDHRTSVEIQRYNLYYNIAHKEDSECPV